LTPFLKDVFLEEYFEPFLGSEFRTVKNTEKTRRRREERVFLASLHLHAAVSPTVCPSAAGAARL
jgi:hypothetical protein